MQLDYAFRSVRSSDVDGLRRSRVADGAVGYIADLAAGDAREGIALLRRAARRARSDGLDIGPGLVDDVRGDARAEIRERRRPSLGTHQRALYEVTRDAGAIAASELHDR